MELCKWAVRILSADTLEEKLYSLEIFTDEDPGAPIFWQHPARMLPKRAKGLQFLAESRRLAGLSEEWIINLKNS